MLDPAGTVTHEHVGRARAGVGAATLDCPDERGVPGQRDGPPELVSSPGIARGDLEFRRCLPIVLSEMLVKKQLTEGKQMW